MTPLIALLLLVALLLPASPAAPRDPRQTRRSPRSPSASFDTIRHGVEALGALRRSAAPQILIGALQDGKLYSRTDDKALFIKQPMTAACIDATTGAPAPDVDDRAACKPVRVNNAVRSAIDAALGALRLFAPDAATRLHAAEAVFTVARPGRAAGAGPRAGAGDRCRA